MSAETTVYVIGAYIPNGGTLMAYHLARIVHLRFGVPVVVVTVAGESADHGVFVYDPCFPTIPAERLEQRIGPQDILICNPSFSDRNFGLRLVCTKIMYVQGFSTFKFIDRFFDHYVAVSDTVRDVLLTTYGLQTTVIPPFIADTAGLAPPAWRDRPAHSLLVCAKGDGDLPHLLRARLRETLRRRAPDIEAAIAWEANDMAFGEKMPQRAFYLALGAVRTLLCLSAAEGFGLVPLEAMAMGTAVVGFDGFGGRQYMRRGHNCLVRPYPDLDGVADDLIALIGDAPLAQRLVEAGRQTAACYGYDRFRAAWAEKLDAMLGQPR